jgi:hypothetical protein
MGALSTFRNLAGGRLPPLTRTALGAGLATFVLALVFFEPGSGGEPPANLLADPVRLVSPGDARAESVLLLDPSAVYFPDRGSSTKAGSGEVGQPEDAPFARPGPVLQFDPSKPSGDQVGLQLPRYVVPSPAAAIGMSAIEPYATFGSHGYRTSILDPRAGFFEIYPIGGAKTPLVSGKIENFNLNINLSGAKNSKNNPPDGVLEVIVSVDSFGQAPLGAVLRRTGSQPADEAILSWARSVSWGARLSPGAYRLIVGP